MKRLEKLRTRALDGVPSKSEFYYLFYKKFGKKTEGRDFSKYAEAFKYAFSNMKPSILDGELIVGEFSGEPVGEQKAEWESVYMDIAKESCTLAGGGQDSHMAIDYELVLGCGLNGIIQRIDDYLETATHEKRAFYLAAKTCLLAVIEHSNAYADHAEHLSAAEADPERRDELYEIARICRRVPANPAESFYEAVQSVHFITYCISLDPLRFGIQQFQLGRPDRYLYPYYKKDFDSGKISKERAQLLLDCLGIQINMRVSRGLSSGYMVGGRDRDGKVVSNELTEMLMQVIEDIKLVYPAVGLCYTPDMPEQYLDTACRLLLHGRSHPAIFNDDLIAEGLRFYGIEESESHNYVQSTCVEITPVATSNVWVASPYTNMPGLLLETMSSEYDSFDEHFSAFFELLDKSICKNFETQSQFRMHRAKNSMCPLLSCFVKDCLERGEDINGGAARYNWIMPSFVGVANLVDSLYALKKVVYEDKKYTVCQLKKILDEDFKNDEALRCYLLNDIPKYGNDDDDVDGYFSLIIEHIVSECRKYGTNFSGGNLIPSVFCWVNHERFGKNTGATPDGRHAGFPLGDGSGPCQGREANGPTASILSSTKWDHTKLIGGVAVNMKFSKSSLGENSLNIMKSLFKTFISRGGFEMQINVIDRETLEKARVCPEEYRDLVVRIGGYSDYFTRISPEMQAEIILRTEHKI